MNFDVSWFDVFGFAVGVIIAFGVLFWFVFSAWNKPK